MTTEQDNREVFKSWYERNRDSYNALRRQRYATEPDRRTKAQAKSTAYKDRVEGGHVPSPTEIYRTLGGVSVRVYRNSEACRMIECSSTAILRWEKDKWIPKPSVPGKRRLYTSCQLMLMRKFHVTNRRDHDARQAVSAYIFENWN